MRDNTGSTSQNPKAKKDASRPKKSQEKINKIKADLKLTG